MQRSLVTLVPIACLLLTVAGSRALPARAGPALQPVAISGIPGSGANSIPGHLTLFGGFEVNRGQTDSRVAFLVHGPGYTLFLTRTGIIFSSVSSSPVLRGLTPSTRLAPLPSHDTRTQAPSLLRLGFVGANPRPRVVGLDRLSGRVNYFRGNDPKKWLVDIPTYAQVVYRGLYPGIDLLMRAHGPHLEYQWLVHPGAQAGAIRLAVQGGGRARIDSRGDLSTVFGQTVLTQGKPATYQGVGSSRREVPSRFVLHNNHVLTVQIGRYDHATLLTIDPTVGYAVALGGSDYANGQGIAVDSHGSAYVVGFTQSADFPTSHALQPSEAGIEDAVVFKLNPAGTALLYSTFIGGSDSDEGLAIALDRTGAAYITGSTLSTDFPTVQPFQAHSRARCMVGQSPIPCSNAFIARLSPSGDRLLYSTYLGGDNGDDGYGIAVDAAGDAYITGVTTSDNFPVRHAWQGAPAVPGCIGEACDDAFVAELAPSGRTLVYSTYLGGRGNDDGNGIAIDTRGDAYITGVTLSADFPKVHPLLRSLPSAKSPFIAELAPGGRSLLYSTYLSAGGNATGVNIAVRRESAYVAIILDGGAGLLIHVSTGGRGIVYSSHLIARGEPFGVAIDTRGDAWVAGDTGSRSFPLVNPVQDARAGKLDAYLSELDPSGSRLLESTFIGGSDNDVGLAVALDSGGNAYVTGFTDSSDFPATNDIPGSDGNGLFVVRIGSSPLISHRAAPSSTRPEAPHQPPVCKPGYTRLGGACRKSHNP